MPAIKVDYVPLPYVGPRYENSGHGRTLADLMLQRGNQEAALHLQRGDNAARAWQGAGQSIMGAVNDWQQRVEYNRQAAIDNAREARRAEAEGLQIRASKGALEEQERRTKGAATARAVIPLARRENGVYGYDRDLIAREMEAAGHGDLLPDVFAKLDEQEAGYLKVQEARTDAVAADAWRVLQGGAADAETVGELMRAWKENNLVPAGDLKMFEAAMKQHGPERALLAAVQSSPRFAEMVQKMQEANRPDLATVAPGSSVYDQRNPQAGVLFTAPAEPETPASIEAALLDAERRGDTAAVQRYMGMKRELAAAGRAPAAPRPSEPLETVIGPDGKAVMVPRSEAVGKQPANVREQTSTGAQKRVFQFFQRAQQAEADVANVEEEVAGMNLGGQAWLKFAPNFLQTDKGQLYNQAQRAFTEARLRKDSGAAIPPHEYEADRKTYFAEPGDSAETLEQKRRARANVLSALAFESGRAVSEFYGDEADGILTGLRTRAGGGKSSKPATADGDGWQVVDGIRIRVKPGGGD